MRPIAGKHALLTGGSKGLGPLIAHALASQGVHVALAARSEAALKKQAEELAALGVKSAAFAADVTDPASLEALVRNVEARFGPIEILVNNAGVEWVSRYFCLEPGEIESMVRTNLLGAMLLTRMALPAMLERGQGHIVTMSSLGGKKGSPYSATYAATKAGLIEWTSGLREELRGTGVSASVICPGFVSQAGMFAVYGKTAPKIVGETTPEKVSEAVLSAILKDRQEIIVNPGPIRPMRVLDAIHPGIGSWLLRKFGVYGFYKAQADENEREKQEG